MGNSIPPAVHLRTSCRAQGTPATAFPRKETDRKLSPDSRTEAIRSAMSLEAHELQRVAKVYVLSVPGREIKRIKSPDVLAQEPHAALGSERTVGSKEHMRGSEEIQTAAQGGGRPADRG